MPIVYLLPGDLHIARQPAIISTILGSCISICLYAPSLRTGAMCHCLLPFSSEKNGGDQPFKYLDQAIKHMILKMEEMGIGRNKFFAQIFGGSDMFRNDDSSESNHVFQRGNGRIPYNSIGKQNIEAARAILQAYRVPVRKEDLGGYRGRKIFFHCSTGEVQVKEICSNLAADKMA